MTYFSKTPSLNNLKEYFMERLYATYISFKEVTIKFDSQNLITKIFARFKKGFQLSLLYA